MRRNRHVWLNGAIVLLSVGILFSASASESTDNGGKTNSIVLAIYFRVSAERVADFEKMYAESYVPALKLQQGYLGSHLLRVFPDNVSREIEAMPTEFNYEIVLVFDTEANRRKWVASKEHTVAWPLASGMAEKSAWRGFDVVAQDGNVN